MTHDSPRKACATLGCLCRRHETHLQHIRTETEGGIGRLILDRPEKRNAMSRAMWRAIPGAVERLDADASVRVILLQGQGPDFAAGADIAEFDTVYGTRADATAYAADLEGAMRALRSCATPSVAAIRGACIGGGVALALSCSLRFAEADARFAITPAKLGIAYCFADTRRLVEQIGAASSRDLLYSGRMLDAHEALRIRLIDRVCETGTLDEQVLNYAHILAANSPASIAVARDFIDRALGGQRGDDAATWASYLDILEGPDFHEGKAAFRQKRKPRF
jgi:enoyl-CoA hydratase/carnithine racemase